MKKGLLLFLVILLGTSQILMAQTKRITGNVTSAEDGQPIPGVSITVKGTTIGTITTIDGDYQLNVPTDATTLVFSFVGMQPKETQITSLDVYNVVLEPDVIGVDEVLVVAYGTQKKESIVGSISSMRGDEKLDQVPISSLDKALQGNVAGVVATSPSGQPGGRTQVRIRGISSMGENNEPLYVIDGVPVLGTQYVSFTSESSSMASREATNPLANINPNDIESISILKDASASSLYGSRASNGVILITTKRGKRGETKFKLNTQSGFSQKTNNKYDVLNKQEYEELAAEAIVNGLGWTQEDADEYVQTNDSTDWGDVVYRDPLDAMTHSIELSATGGTEKTKFFVSGSYFTQEGHTIGTDFERYTSRVNLDHKANNKFNFGINMSVSYSEKNSNNGSSAFASPILAADLMLPNVPVFNEDGTYNNTNLGMLNNFNPVAIKDWDINSQNEVYFIGQAFAQYNFLDNLSFKTTINTEIYNLKELKYSNGAFSDGRTVGGRIREGRNTVESWTSSNVLSWDNTFNEKHNLNVLGGFEANKWQNSGIIASGTGLPETPKFRSLAAAAEPETAFTNTTEYSIVSFFSHLEYNYNNKYYVSGSVRRDGHSRFGIDNKYGNFWSAGASWRITQEKFMSNMDFLDDLKLRVSYGVVGDASGIGDYAPLGLFSYNGFTYNGNAGASFIQYANPALTWAKNKKFNTAIDFTLFSRVSGSIEYYIETSSDFLFDVPVSATTGLYSPSNEDFISPKNLGSLRNSGFEFQVRSENIRGKFTWVTDFNIALNKSEVLELPDDKDLIDGTKIRRVGEDYQSFYLRRWHRVNPDDGTPQWLDAEGNVVDSYPGSDDRVIVGSASPDFQGGITNTFSYKGFELSALVTFAVGHYIYDSWAFVMESDGGYILSVNQNDKALDRWQEPGDITDVPQLILGGNNNADRTSTRYLHKADYARLKNLRLAYNIPDNVTKSIGLDNIKVYAQGQNLLTLTDYPGKDPEVQVNGIEDWFYPPLRTITLGLTVDF